MSFKIFLFLFSYILDNVDDLKSDVLVIKKSCLVYFLLSESLFSLSVIIFSKYFSLFLFKISLELNYVVFGVILKLVKVL
jgi:hypothetical protein